MIFQTTDDSNTLQNIVLNRHESNNADQLDILSGYVGIQPIKEITKNKNIKTTIIYGMFNEKSSIHNSKNQLHLQLVQTDLENNNLSVYYPKTMSHAKCYIWRKKNDIVSVLLGSANFSSKGLLTPGREVLSEVNATDWESVDHYYKKILNSSVHCYQEEIPEDFDNVPTDSNVYETLSLHSERSKINWGYANAHTHPRDAYIPIQSPGIISKFPDLFPAKTKNTGLSRKTGSDNDPIEVIWDDGESMTCLMEGTSVSGQLRYPNKISSYGSKKILGDYLRKRLGVNPGDYVTKEIFKNYGRDNITISLSSDGVYYMDFSGRRRK